MADDDILALNQLIRDYGTEYQAPERLRMPMKERLYANYTPASKTEQAEMLLSMLPGIGEGLDIAHMTKDVQEGNYGQAGLSGLAMALPGIGAGVIKKLYHGSPTSGQILPDPNKAVETKSASFLTDNEDVAYTFTLPREYGEPKFYDDFGNEIEPGSVTEIYTDIKNPFTLKGDEAQKFIDDSSYQQKVINKAKAEGFDSVIAENVYEGIGERYKNNVYAVFNKEQMTLDAPKQAISSADTSLRQVPALFKKQDIDFPEGGTNFDIGGGRFDEGTKYLADERGVENFVYDPYNRSPEHNAAVMDRMRTEAADTATADGIVTFCDATTAADGNVWQLQIEAIQSTDDGATTADKSLHTLVWDSAVAGGELDFTFQPHGNAVATASQPHYTGIVTVEAGAYPEVGGTAGNDSFTWSYTFTVKDNTVTKVVS